jgi:two-component system NtrC family sensor kinase
VFCNLLHNAIDASPEGSEITAKGFRLTRTEPGRYWIRFLVVDQGEGIAPENLKRVFTPYFTTKDRRDERKGFGLGLAICRKIVHLHEGNLSITSELRKGTTVQLDLPSRQMKKSNGNGKPSP